MSLSSYLSTVGNRDKVMGIMQFLPMLASGPAAALGQQKLAEALLKLSKLADGYRAVTRLSGTVDMLDPARLAGLGQVRDPIVRRLGGLEFMFTLCFFPYEHLALMGTFGVLSGDGVGRFSGMAVFCWMWSNLLHTIRVLYQILLEYPYISPKARDAASIKRTAEFRKKILDFIKTFAFLLFSIAVLPAEGKPQLLTNPSGPLLPLHKMIELMTPKKFTLSAPMLGLLGMIATTTDIIMSQQ